MKIPKFKINVHFGSGNGVFIFDIWLDTEKHKCVLFGIRIRYKAPR